MNGVTFSIIDIALVKWSSICFGMIVGAFYHEYVRNNIWVFAFFVLLFALKPAYNYLTRKKDIYSSRCRLIEHRY
jgi:hypothetical protein